MLATFPLSYLSWRYVELPVRRGSYWKGWRIVAAGAAATAASLCLGYAAIATDGLPGRIAPEILALKAHRSERGERHNVTMERVDAGDLRIRGAPGEVPSFVLVGDSHAAAISGGVFAAAARVGLSGYQFTADWFRPLPGIKMEKRPTRRSYAQVRRISSRAPGAANCRPGRLLAMASDGPKLSQGKPHFP